MTRESVREYAEAVRRRYRVAGRKGKQQILDGFGAATGMHRKAAIRLLNRTSEAVVQRRGHPRRYGLEIRRSCDAVDVGYCFETLLISLARWAAAPRDKGAPVQRRERRSCGSRQTRVPAVEDRLVRGRLSLVTGQVLRLTGDERRAFERVGLPPDLERPRAGLGGVAADLDE